MRKYLHKLIIIHALLILLLSCKSLKDNDETYGAHQWIVPRPAAEIHIRLIDSENEPITNAKLWIYLGDERTQTPEGFINYDKTTGAYSDDLGEITLQYLGEEGGGYPLSIDDPGPPHIKADIEAQGYVSQVINLDLLLFGMDYRIGNTEIEYAGEKTNMVVVDHEVILEKE